MPKNYFCKDCIDNNNGWCDKKKCQGLKLITSCDNRRLEEEEYLPEVTESKNKEELHQLIDDVEEALTRLRNALI